ncbi:MAG: hypothetical protein E6744_01520 [Veillonella sp.]|jgi:hypothetical protein|nr:hypothetical protein [Veillonella sp.]
MLKRILQYISLCIALVSLLILAGCSSDSASSQSKGPEGEWIAYSGYTVQNVVSAVDSPIYTMKLTVRNDVKTIYTANLTAYNYQYTTPEKRPVIESTQMLGDIKEARLNYITALTIVMSANDIVGNADSSTPNTIKMDITGTPNTELIYDSKTDTITFMNQTFKRVSDTNNLQTLADAYKKELQVASNKYLEDIGNAANPKTKFITTYSFDDSIIKDNKK